LFSAVISEHFSKNRRPAADFSVHFRNRTE